MNWWEKRKIRKFLESLPKKKLEKLKKYLETHCIHGIRFDSDIPCLACMSNGDISDLIPFLLKD